MSCLAVTLHTTKVLFSWHMKKYVTSSLRVLVTSLSLWKTALMMGSMLTKLVLGRKSSKRLQTIQCS